jgi:hypothetical protein
MLSRNAIDRLPESRAIDGDVKREIFAVSLQAATRFMVNRWFKDLLQVKKRRVISLLNPFFSLCSTNIKRFP